MTRRSREHLRYWIIGGRSSHLGELRPLKARTLLLKRTVSIVQDVQASP